MLTDDWITRFSSRGDGRWNPTVAATGMNVWMDRYYWQAGENGVFSGTSASAPHTSATIGLMLEANPLLTLPQIKFILQTTAVPITRDARLEGAGVLNTVAAVVAAKARVIPNTTTIPSVVGSTNASSSSLMAQIPQGNLSTQSPHP
ncbi:MAG: S8 family serine peptidase [Vampirovibrionales bacterium]